MSVPQSLGPQGTYKIMSQVGRGGFATVYKAHHASLDRYVAIKILRQDMIRDQADRDRFQREARSAARLGGHPHIVTVFDYGEHDDMAYLVLEFIDGTTLESRIERPMPLAEAEQVVNAVASALDHAHSHHLVHRDIKPANVLLGKDGRIVLSDFGIAKVLDTANSLTGAVIGTPEYMAPEQAMGAAVDARTDIYSFGVMIFRMLAGRVPFEGAMMPVIFKHMNEQPPPMSSFGRPLPADVEAVVARALAKDPAQRYDSAGELAATLSRAMQPAILLEQAQAALRAGEMERAEQIVSQLSATGAMDSGIRQVQLEVERYRQLSQRRAELGGLLQTGDWQAALRQIERQGLRNSPDSGITRLVRQADALGAVEAQRQQAETERARVERETREQAERQRQEQERLERERQQREREAREQAERQRQEQEKQERERLKRERMEQEKLERERQKREKQERERLNREKQEQEKRARAAASAARQQGTLIVEPGESAGQTAVQSTLDQARTSLGTRGLTIAAAAVLLVAIAGTGLAISSGSQPARPTPTTVAIATLEPAVPTSPPTTAPKPELKPTAPPATAAPQPTALPPTAAPKPEPTAPPKPEPKPEPLPTSPPPLADRVQARDGVEMALVPDGEFIMGSRTDSVSAPRFSPALPPFYIDIVAVTNARYARFVEQTGHRGAGDWQRFADPANFDPQHFDRERASHPVVNVTWNDAEAYCAWAGKRLPTEAEWEKAARGSDGRRWPWGDQPHPEFANVWTHDESAPEPDTKRVGSFPRGVSPFGALDMIGNVRHWTASSLHAYPLNQEALTQRTTDSGSRVVRGASWLSLPENIEVARRMIEPATLAAKDLGFRCVASVDMLRAGGR